MKKKILTSLLAVGLLFCCFTAQVEAEEGTCSHVTRRLETSRTVTEGYNHTYTAPGGITKGCVVTKGTFTYVEVCVNCDAQLGSGSGTFEDHSTNHN